MNLLLLLSSAAATTIQLPGPLSHDVIVATSHVGVSRQGAADVLVSRVAGNGIWVRGPAVPGGVFWYLPQYAVPLGLFDDDGDGTEELFVKLGLEIIAFDPLTGAENSRRTIPNVGSNLQWIDLDGVGPPEVLFRNNYTGIEGAVSLDHGILWQTGRSSGLGPVSNRPEFEHVPGQFDADPELELASDDGIRDALTGAILSGQQWSGNIIGVGDLDADGIDDLILDVDPNLVATRIDGTQLWTVPRPLDAPLSAIKADLELDGVVEVLLEGGPPAGRRVATLDAQNGQILKFESGLECSAFTTVQTLNNRFGACMGPNSMTLIMPGGYRHRLAQAARQDLVVTNLDGVGPDEIVLTGPITRVFDDGGNQLGPRLGSSHSTVGMFDTDGDGTVELVGNGRRLSTYTWDPVHGFLEDRVLLTRPVNAEKVAFADLDGDGTAELLHDEGGDVSSLDLQTGGGTDLMLGALQWGLWDFDRDGNSEVWCQSTTRTDVHFETPIGTRTGSRSTNATHAYAAQRYGQPRLFVQERSDIRIYELRGLSVVLVHSLFSPTSSPTFWAGDLLWYNTISGVEAWNPLTDTTWQLASDVSLERPPLIHNGVVWLVGQGVLERWAVP